jgi:hypothetical protein
VSVEVSEEWLCLRHSDTRIPFCFCISLLNQLLAMTEGAPVLVPRVPLLMVRNGNAPRQRSRP